MCAQPGRSLSTPIDRWDARVQFPRRPSVHREAINDKAQAPGDYRCPFDRRIDPGDCPGPDPVTCSAPHRGSRSVYNVSRPILSTGSAGRPRGPGRRDVHDLPPAWCDSDRAARYGYACANNYTAAYFHASTGPTGHSDNRRNAGRDSSNTADAHIHSCTVLNSYATATIRTNGGPA